MQDLNFLKKNFKMKKMNCDLLVAGAGIAGMCAAVSAARHGLKVILINDQILQN